MSLYFKQFFANVHKHDDLWDVLWVGQQFYELLGLSPLRYRGPGMTPVAKRVPWGAIVMCVVFLGIFVVHCVTDSATINSDSYILANGLRWFHQTVSLFTCSVAVINVISCKKIADLVFSLYDVDLKISTLGYQINHKAQNRWLNSAALLIISALVALSTFTAYLTYKIAHGSFVKFCVIFFTVCAINIVISNYSGQTIIVEYCLQYRFKSLRKYFCQLFPTEPEQMNSFRLCCISKNRSVLNERIAQLAELHYFLIQLTDRYNDVFGLQLLLTHLGATLMTIVSWFSVYRVVLRSEEDSNHVVAINVTWSMYYSIYQLMYTLMGAQVSFEAKQMGIVVHKAIEFITDEEIRDELLLFSSQIDQRCPEITCQLFVLNGTLVLSTIGFVCTYLVVLIQFDLTTNA